MTGSFPDDRKTGMDKGLVSSEQADELRNKTLARGGMTLGQAFQESILYPENREMAPPSQYGCSPIAEYYGSSRIHRLAS